MRTRGLEPERNQAPTLSPAYGVFYNIKKILKTADRCAVVVGLDSPYQIIPSCAIDSWLEDPIRKQRFLFVADRTTTLEDVLWHIDQ